MQLRRIITTYALALGVSLLLLGGGSSPAAVGPGLDSPARQGRAATMPAEAAAEAIESAATPRRRSADHFRLGHADIPVTALLAYRRAADIMAKVKPSCDLSWTLLAAIGRVESDHGRHAGATLAPDGVSTPRVLGVALDGAGAVAAIRDTDQGRWDGDSRWDHAVGPMQFLPTTWQLVGVDADGDGARSMDDIDDAALAAGVYLCAGAGSGLGSRVAMEEALHRYNDSEHYVALVMAYEAKYRGGDFEVLTPSDGVAESMAALVSQPLSALDLGSQADAPVPTGLAAEVRGALATTKKLGGTTIQTAAVTRTPSNEGASGSSAGAKISGDASGSSGSGPSATKSPSGASSPSSDGGGSPATSDQGGTGAPAPAGGGTAGGTPAGGGGSPATPEQGGSDSGAGTADGSSGSPSGTPTPAPDTPESPDTTPTPTPTPTSTTVTAVLTHAEGAYLLGGKTLDLGVVGDLTATAVGDFDGDGSVETNGDELAGMVGNTVTMVVVEREDGTLGIYSINGIALG